MKIVALIPILVAAGMVKGQAGADYIALGKNLANPASAFCIANSPVIFADKTAVGIYGQNRFTGTNLINGGVAGYALVNKTAFGFNTNYIGTGVFNRRNLELNIGQKINNKVSVGINAGIMDIHQGFHYGTRKYLTGKIAASFTINSKLETSTVLVNPWRTQNLYSGLESQLHLVLGYKVNDQTKIWAQIRQTQGEQSIYGMAIQYKLEKLCFNGSFQSGLEPLAAGIRYCKKDIQFSFSSGYHVYLGFSPTFSILWVKK